MKFLRIYQTFVYLILLTMSYIFFYLFTKIKIEGNENIPKEGRFILAANHQNFFDGSLVAIAMGPFKKVSFLISRRSLKTKFYINLAKTIGSVTLGSGIEEYHRSIKKLNNILTHGGIVGIFPEGTVTNFSTPIKFKGGVAKLSLDSQTVVVPIFINGTYNLRFGKYLLNKPEITIKIGKPIDLYNYAELAGNNLDKMAAILREKIIDLSDNKAKEEKILEVNNLPVLEEVLS